MPSLRPGPTTGTIKLRGTTVTYIVRRHPRAKYMRITISPFHGVVVTLPARLRRYVNPEEMLREKQDWVLEQLGALDIPPMPRPLTDGSTVHYRGRPLTVRLRSGRIWHGCEVVGEELHAHLPLDFDGDVKAFVLAWIKQQAADHIVAEAKAVAAEIGVTYTRLTVRDQKTKWGSCSKAGAISFNWRLVLFPPRVMRYVVVHEMCHRRHFNHSDRFWKLVERHDPRYEESVRWLRENGLRMEASLR